MVLHFPVVQVDSQGAYVRVLDARLLGRGLSGCRFGSFGFEGAELVMAVGWH